MTDVETLYLARGRVDADRRRVTFTFTREAFDHPDEFDVVVRRLVARAEGQPVLGPDGREHVGEAIAVATPADEVHLTVTVWDDAAWAIARGDGARARLNFYGDGGRLTPGRVCLVDSSGPCDVVTRRALGAGGAGSDVFLAIDRAEAAMADFRQLTEAARPWRH